MGILIKISWRLRWLFFGQSKMRVSNHRSSLAANQVMSRCQGAAILAFARWRCTPSNHEDMLFDLPFEYNHFEGALAFSCKLPLLVITDRKIRTSGITLLSEGPVIFWPDNIGPEWINNKSFLTG